MCVPDFMFGLLLGAALCNAVFTCVTWRPFTKRRDLIQRLNDAEARARYRSKDADEAERENRVLKEQLVQALEGGR